MYDAALQNQYHFSGVIAMHIYNKLTPSIAISGAFNKSINKPATKNFDEYLIEQLDDPATKNYFYMIAGIAFLMLPLFAVYSPYTGINHIAKYWWICLLLVYLQTSITFEAFLIYKALTR